MTETIDHTRPPKPLARTARAFPEFSALSLTNGIPVYLVESHRQPYVSVSVGLRSGASSDGEIAGLAHFVSTILLSGAGRRNAQKLAEEIDFIGATLDAGAGRDDIAVKLGVLTSFLPEALDLMADVTLRPTFPRGEISRERRHAIADLKQAQADPSWLADQRFRREIYGDTAYGSEIDGTEESLKKIRREECLSFHRGHFSAANAFVVAAGDVEAQDLIGLLEPRFGAIDGDAGESWSGAAPTPPPMVDLAPPTGPRVVIVDRPGAVQSAIRVGTLARRRRDAEHIPLVLLHTLFGGYFNSRINHNLRERNGFTYGANSVVDAGMMPGTFSVRASVGNDVTGAAVREILRELAIISSEPVPDDELQMARNYIIGTQSLQLETPGQVAGFVRTIALYGLPPDYYNRYPEALRSITADSLLEIASTFLSPSRMVIVVVGDAKKIAGQLDSIGAE